jgi:hypothetical protein
MALLKRALGPAGEGRHWHHIVEQSKLAQFGANAIYNTDNVVSLADDVHYRITGFYNSIQDFTDGQTDRQWLNGRTFEFQYEFGMDVLRKFGALLRVTTFSTFVSENSSLGAKLIMAARSQG